MATKIDIRSDNYHGVAVVADMFRLGVVAPIIEVQGLPIGVDDVLVVVDDTSIGVPDDGARIIQIPTVWADIIYQLTANRFSYLLRLSQAKMREQSSEENALMIYSALRHVSNGDNGLVYNRRYDIETWSELLSLSLRGNTPDVMTARVYPVYMNGESEDGTLGENSAIAIGR